MTYLPESVGRSAFSCGHDPGIAVKCRRGFSRGEVVAPAEDASLTCVSRRLTRQLCPDHSIRPARPCRPQHRLKGCGCYLLIYEE